ncbi:MAG: L-serine ammonia-lyase, partial [Pseudomonadota bacterium]|nr:L-serine ammonia-lyase [Pseudomonadota bacterium]
MISVFELFKIGVGPSSSHTVGPMRAAGAFAGALATERVASVRVTLMGSLAFTGKGHATDRAVILGLAGQRPDTLDATAADEILRAAHAERALMLAGRRRIGFDPAKDIVFDYVTPATSHPNTMRLAAFDAGGGVVAQETWLSVGGGFVVREGEALGASDGPAYPLPFRDARDLLRLAAANNLSIAELMRRNEIAVHGAEAVEAKLDGLLAAMFDCLERGLGRDGELPGGLKVQRRAKAIYARLNEQACRNARAAHEIMDFVSVYAMAVNEENAAGGRVVTAPTNGAAGVIPAVLRYYRDHCEGAGREGLHRFLLTAGAVGALFKLNASISGAEVGCQGEVGVASSMAAAGLCAALGGANAQIENAA